MLATAPADRVIENAFGTVIHLVFCHVASERLAVARVMCRHIATKVTGYGVPGFRYSCQDGFLKGGQKLVAECIEAGAEFLRIGIGDRCIGRIEEFFHGDLTAIDSVFERFANRCRKVTHNGWQALVDSHGRIACSPELEYLAGFLKIGCQVAKLGRFGQGGGRILGIALRQSDDVADVTGNCLRFFALLIHCVGNGGDRVQRLLGAGIDDF